MGLAVARVPEFRIGRSLTTRSPRPDDTMYDYATEAEFHAAFERGELLERDEHMGAWYGKRVPTDDGAWIIELDVHGAETAKQKLPQAIKVLIKPPDPMAETLRPRLEGRTPRSGEASPELEILLRLERAEYEVKYAREHGTDFVIVNRDGQIAQAVDELVAIMYWALRQAA
jgi:guanylate kinase